MAWANSGCTNASAVAVRGHRTVPGTTSPAATSRSTACAAATGSRSARAATCPQRCARPEHRQRTGDGDGRRRQLTQQRQHERRDDLGRSGTDGGDPVCGRCRSGVPQRAMQCPEQQRVALGDLVTGQGEPRVDRVAQGTPDERGGGADAQRARPQHGGGRLVPQRIEQLGRHPRRLGRAGGDDEQHRQVGDASGEMGQGLQRDGVGPVRVVGGEQERLMVGQVGEQPVDAVERREGRDAAGSGRIEHGGGQPGGPVPRHGADGRIQESAHHTEHMGVIPEKTRGRTPRTRTAAVVECHREGEVDGLHQKVRASGCGSRSTSGCNRTSSGRRRTASWAAARHATTPCCRNGPGGS